MILDALPLAKVALVLGVSYAETRRLVRERKLKVHHVQDRVRYFDPAQVLDFINANRRYRNG